MVFIFISLLYLPALTPPGRRGGEPLVSISACHQHPAHSRLMSLPSRLANLTYAQLLGLAVDGCESSPELKNKADALIAAVAPLPLWCVDALLSPDLLPQLFSSLGLSEHAAAGACTTWSRAYSRQLRSCGYDSWPMCPMHRLASACCPAACWRSPCLGLTPVA